MIRSLTCDLYVNNLVYFYFTVVLNRQTRMSSRMIFSCKYCRSFRASKYAVLLKHFRSVHEHEPNFKICCSKSYNTVTAHMQHMKLKHNRLQSTSRFASSAHSTGIACFGYNDIMSQASLCNGETNSLDMDTSEVGWNCDKVDGVPEKKEEQFMKRTASFVCVLRRNTSWLTVWSMHLSVNAKV